jgi:hypothetical protein
LKVPGIVPPFGFKFRMRKMVLGKREGSSRKSAFELLPKKRRGKGNKGQENCKTTSHCDPKAKQSHLPEELLITFRYCKPNRIENSIEDRR